MVVVVWGCCCGGGGIRDGIVHLVSVGHLLRQSRKVLCYSWVVGHGVAVLGVCVRACGGELTVEMITNQNARRSVRSATQVVARCVSHWQPVASSELSAVDRPLRGGGLLAEERKQTQALDGGTFCFFSGHSIISR